MKALILKYRSVLRFVVLFLGTYIFLSLLYGGYLKVSEGGKYYPDFVTHLVAKQSSTIISGFGYKAEIVPAADVPSMDLIINNQPLARIVEGCNALSIIVLFISFIIAFAEKFKKTALFLLAGAVLIYAVNILRIVILSIALYHYPQHQHILHGVVFPGIIYGMVFLLWMLWVRMLKQKTAPSE